MSDDAQRRVINNELLLKVGDALDRSDVPGAIGALSQASGSVLPPATAEDDEELEDQQAQQGVRRRRKKPPPLLDASGYPTIASLKPDELGALVRAAWARCHGRAVRQTGYVRAYRRLLERSLVEVAPKSLSGDEITWYAATALGALVVLKAMLNGNRRVVRAATELR